MRFGRFPGIIREFDVRAAADGSARPPDLAGPASERASGGKLRFEL